MATIVKIDVKQDLGITLADFNANGHLGTFEVPVWSQDLYAGKTDEEIFDDWALGIYESFTPIIGEALAWLSIANKPYFGSDKIRENVRRAIYQEISNWMMNVPYEVKNNVNFSAQAGFSFSLSIQPWLINYDEFNIKTRTFIQETGLVGVCVEDLEGIELWIKPIFKNDVELHNVDFTQLTGEDATKWSVPSLAYMTDRIQFAVNNAHKQIAGDISVDDKAEADALVSGYNAGAILTLNDGTSYDKNGSTIGDVIFFIPKPGSSFITEEAVVLVDHSLLISTTANVDDARLATVEEVVKENAQAVGAISDEDVNNVKIDNSKDVVSLGTIDPISETKKLPTREDVRSFVEAIRLVLAGQTQTLTITQLEAADELLRSRLDALEQQASSGKKVFDTGATLASGDYAPKKNMILFSGDVATGGTVDLTKIPATSMDDGTAYVATDFALNNDTPPQGPEIQVVIYGDESDPVTTEDSLDAEWTGTQSFGTMRAGKLHGDDLSTGHWSANVTVDNAGIVTIKNIVIHNDPAGVPYKVTRFILVQSTLDTTLATTVPYYSKTESDTKYALKSVETTKQDRVDNSLTTTAKIIPRAIDENKTSGDAREKLIADIMSKKVSGGDLGSTAETVATEKFVIDADAKKQDVLTESLTLTYDDGTTEAVKVGK